MKLTISSLLLIATIVSAVPHPDLPVLSDYEKLFKLCQDGGSDAYVGVKYDKGYTTTFSYDQCYPYAIDGNNAQMAVFCKSALCASKPNSDCSGKSSPPSEVLLPAGLTLVNAADFVHYIGNGALCTYRAPDLEAAVI